MFCTCLQFHICIILQIIHNQLTVRGYREHALTLPMQILTNLNKLYSILMRTEFSAQTRKLFYMSKAVMINCFSKKYMQLQKFCFAILCNCEPVDGGINCVQWHMQYVHYCNTVYFGTRMEQLLVFTLQFAVSVFMQYIAMDNGR